MAHSVFLRSFAKHWMKPLTLIALAVPFLYLALQWTLLLTGQPHVMGWSAGKWTHSFLGDTAVRTLLLTLAVSPVRDITGWAPIALIRRRIGLAAFFYAFLHMLAYVGLDLRWSLTELWNDLTIRIYITFGMAALVMMIPLALTSNNASIRKLGRATWDKLHWLIYPLAILAVAHNFLMQKTFEITPAVHVGILVVLLGWRVGKWSLKRLRPAEAAG